MTAPRCVVCGAPGTDPQPFADRTTHAITHLPYCVVGRVIALAGSDAYPFAPGDYMSDKTRGAA